MTATSKARWVRTVVIVVGTFGVFYLGVRLWNAERDVRCKAHMRDLYPTLLGGDGRFRSEWELRTALASDTRAAARMLCPACSSSYVYKPLEGRPRYDSEGLRVILYCPRPCHQGHRNVLLENGAVIEAKADADLSRATTREGS